MKSRRPQVPLIPEVGLCRLRDTMNHPRPRLTAEPQQFWGEDRRAPEMPSFLVAPGWLAFARQSVSCGAREGRCMGSIAVGLLSTLAESSRRAPASAEHKEPRARLTRTPSPRCRAVALQGPRGTRECHRRDAAGFDSCVENPTGACRGGEEGFGNVSRASCCWLTSPGRRLQPKGLGALPAPGPPGTRKGTKGIRRSRSPRDLFAF